MELDVKELQEKIEVLSTLNAELLKKNQEYASAKQSFSRMSARLRKLCKKLTPSTEMVVEMQTLADDIRDLTKTVTAE